MSATSIAATLSFANESSQNHSAVTRLGLIFESPDDQALFITDISGAAKIHNESSRCNPHVIVLVASLNHEASLGPPPQAHSLAHRFCVVHARHADRTRNSPAKVLQLRDRVVSVDGQQGDAETLQGHLPECRHKFWGSIREIADFVPDFVGLFLGLSTNLHSMSISVQTQIYGDQ